MLKKTLPPYARKNARKNVKSSFFFKRSRSEILKPKIYNYKKFTNYSEKRSIKCHTENVQF